MSLQHPGRATRRAHSRGIHRRRRHERRTIRAILRTNTLED